ncbi:hypothetical protein HYX13_00850, partial [Candidatus Woesearchaeota archaeon]|nr:hypothetical protein [Candidatus Woesearchaeota archaeon]
GKNNEENNIEEKNNEKESSEKESSKDKTRKDEILTFIKSYLYLDDNAAESIYQYFAEQFYFSVIPSDKKIIIEKYTDRGRLYVIFHTLFGRRVNDCLSRALAFVIGRSQHRDVEVGVTDNGFYLSAEQQFNAFRAFGFLQAEDFRAILDQSIDRSEVLQRRFRHCAARSLMILRDYMGRRKNAGRMQVGSKILLNAVKRISNDFPILKEARREVLEDLMDYEHAQWIVKEVNEKRIQVIETENKIPSPFAFSLVVGGYSDVIKIEDKQEFLKRMHQQVLAQIALKQGKNMLRDKKAGKNSDPAEQFSYRQFWEERQKELDENKDTLKEKLKMQVWNLKHLPGFAKEELIKLIEFGSMRKEVWDECKVHLEDVENSWPDELKFFLLEKMRENTQ